MAANTLAAPVDEANEVVATEARVTMHALILIWKLCCTNVLAQLNRQQIFAWTAHCGLIQGPADILLSPPSF